MRDQIASGYGKPDDPASVEANVKSLGAQAREHRAHEGVGRGGQPPVSPLRRYTRI